MHLMLFLQDVGAKQLTSIFGSDKICGPYRVVDVAKGLKMGQFKKYTFGTGPNWQYFFEHFLPRFLKIRPQKGQILFEFL